MVVFCRVVAGQRSIGGRRVEVVEKLSYKQGGSSPLWETYLL